MRRNLLCRANDWRGEVAVAELTLVTGAGGFIGDQLIRDLTAKSVPVRAVDKKQLERLSERLCRHFRERFLAAAAH